MGDMGKEPSMEEILSSIKRIIAEESATVVKSTGRPQSRGRAKGKADEAGTDAESQDGVLELTNAVNEDVSSEPVEAGGFMTDETILSDQTATASRNSLAALSALIVRPDDAPSNTLEGLVRDMLRPMLREWLDANLPELVEKMVAKEIARLSEGRL